MAWLSVLRFFTVKLIITFGRSFNGFSQDFDQGLGLSRRMLEVYLPKVVLKGRRVWHLGAGELKAYCLDSIEKLFERFHEGVRRIGSTKALSGFRKGSEIASILCGYYTATSAVTVRGSRR